MWCGGSVATGATLFVWRCAIDELWLRVHIPVKVLLRNATDMGLLFVHVNRSPA